MTPLLQCPFCRNEIDSEAERCDRCGKPFRDHTGRLDFAPDIVRGRGLSQRFMESPIISRIYERTFRPLFTRLGSRTAYGDEEKWLRAYFQPAPGPVLDLACGTGRYTRLLRQLTDPDTKVIGLDLSRPMLDQAQAVEDRDPMGIVYLRGNALRLPFADHSLGGVHCFGAMHLFPNAELAVAEIGRCLAPGGCFTLMTAVQVDSIPRRLLQLLFSKIASFRFFAVPEVRPMLRERGLHVTAWEVKGMLLMLAATREA